MILVPEHLLIIYCIFVKIETINEKSFIALAHFGLKMDKNSSILLILKPQMFQELGPHLKGWSNGPGPRLLIWMFCNLQFLEKNFLSSSLFSLVHRFAVTSLGNCKHQTRRKKFEKSRNVLAYRSKFIRVTDL